MRVATNKSQENRNQRGESVVKGKIRVALAGQPNAGKTSVFNGLTGAHQNVGNYPGVTVEKRIGSYRHDGAHIEVTDLPGTYSLSSFSPEERVAQDELLEHRPDVVVVVVDSTALKRSLVFLAQVMQLHVNPILCLNMSDEARAAGQELDVPLMESLLGFPVVETVGHRREGIDALREAIMVAADNPCCRHRLVLGDRLPRAISAVTRRLEETALPEDHREWAAVKLLMEDDYFAELVGGHGEAGEAALAEAARQRDWLEQDTGQDIQLFVTSRYYGFVDGLLREVMRQRLRANAREASDRIDRVLVHRLLGLPVFLVVMYGIFWLTFTVGEYPMSWIDSGFKALGGWLSGFWAVGSESPLRSLLVDGVIGGVGGVVVFLPNILLLFLGLALLEDTGYMARAAFLVDSIMHRFGLHGKSFLPMLTGFGCTIPGIMATRTLENERDRLTTMLVLPLMSCGARLPIWMLLIPAFFAPPWRAPMLWIIYASGVLLALVLALVLRRSLLQGEEAPFVMELPPYRLPTLRALVGKMWERSWLYVRKAGTVILAISMVLWFATSYPKPDAYRVNAAVRTGRARVVKIPKRAGESAQARQKRLASALTAARAAAPKGVVILTPRQVENRRASERLQHSLAGRVGRIMAVPLHPLGFDWKITTGLIGAFAAKEVFVAQMGIVYSLGQADEESVDLRKDLSRDYSPVVGLALMFFLLIATPCMATVAVTRRESGSWRWAFLQFFGLTAIAYVIALFIYQIGSLVVS